MDLRWRLPDGRHLLARAPSAARWGDVRSALTAVGLAETPTDSTATTESDGSWFADGHRLTDDVPLGAASRPPGGPGTSHSEGVLRNGVLLQWVPGQKCAIPGGHAPGRHDGEQRNGSRHAPPPATESSTPVVALDVVTGPDAGKTLSLSYGRHDIGRGRGPGLHIDDPTVSRRHVTLEVTADAIHVTDLGSTNGTWVDTCRVGPRGAILGVGSRLRLGDSVLTCHVERGRRPSAVDPSPSPAPPVDPVFTLPDAPEPSAADRSHLWTAVIPLAFSLLAALVMRSPLFLLMGLMGPVAAGGQAVADRRRQTREFRSRTARWAEDVRSVEAAVAEAVHRERDELVGRHPDPATAVREFLSSAKLSRTSSAPPPSDPLSVRLGTSESMSSLRVRQGNGRERPVPMPDAPLVRSLGGRVLELSGPRPLALAAARAVLAQFVLGSSPADLRLLVVAGRTNATDWADCMTLPHLARSDGGLDLLVAGSMSAAARLREVAQETPRPTVLLLDGLAPEDGDLAGLVHTPGVGALVVTPMPRTRSNGRVEPDEESGHGARNPTISVRGSCGNGAVDTLDLTPGRRLAVLGGREMTLVADLLSVSTWHDLLAGMGTSPAVLPRPSGSAKLPAVARTATLMDPAGSLGDGADCWSRHLLRRWSEAGASTAFTIGVEADRDHIVDLRTDGPHVLVAGTTGAGKSELLRTLIASLAAANPPDRLGFVLVDYKGGAAFDRCAELPHTRGLVTDLDPAETRRALASLGAELQRRERLLREAGSLDIDALNSTGGRPPLERLVIVVDEFRTLQQEIPEFIDGLLRIAAQGRSLGVHLVLATQRPAGVVTAEMRANLNLRIALRVRDRVDSDDVVECPNAADIPADRPGRAWISRGGEAPVQVQTAWSAHPLDPPNVLLGIQAPENFADPAPFEQLEGVAGEPTTFLEVLVHAARESWRSLNRPQPSSPWLPPLPARLHLSDLLPTAPSDGRGGCEPDEVDRALIVGLMDEPELQRQSSWTWHPWRDGHLAVVGGPRSGRTTTLATILAQVSVNACPQHTLVHVVGRDELLQGWARDAVTSFVSASEPARMVRILERICAGPDARGDTQDSTPHSGRQTEAPRQLLLIDDWGSVKAALEEHDGGRGLALLAEILRSGAWSGTTVVTAGGRELLTGSLGTHFSGRVVLPTTDSADLLLLGLSTDDAGGMPGRARLLPGGQTCQVALPGIAPPSAIDGASAPYPGGGESLRTASAASDGGDVLRGCPHPQPWSMPALPERLDRARLPVADHRDGSVIGVDALGHPARLAVPGAVIIVVGPRRSGRSTALECLAAGLRDAGNDPLLVDGRDLIRDDTGGDLGQTLATRPAAVVLVDDADRIAGTQAESHLLRHCQAIRARARTSGGDVAGAGGVGGLVVACTPQALSTSFGGLLGELRRNMHALVLNPRRADAELFGVPLPSGEPSVPGRGVVIDGADVSVVQVALA